jgi:prepilin-type N-terminal cleavage/methylation domain-containing protein
VTRPPISSPLTRPIAAEDGFTLIELIVAALIMTIGLLALVSGIDHSRELVNRSEQIETATHQAEEAIERVLSRRYEQVAMTSTPLHSDDPTDPRYYVNGTSYQWDQGATGPQSETMVVNATDGAVVASEPWEDSDSRLSGEIHTFVTQTGDRCAGTGCPTGSQTAKRVTVAVSVDGPKAPERPVLISTLMVDPDAAG